MVEIQFDQDSVWSQLTKGESSLYLAGTAFLEGKKQNSEDLFTELNLLATVEEVQKFATKVRGQFSFIFENDEVILAYVDKIRSFPILTYSSNDRLFISNSIKYFDTLKSNNNHNENAVLAFEMSGYTLGNETLYLGLESVEQGSFILYRKDEKAIYKEKYYSFFEENNFQSSTSELLEDLNNVVNQSIARLINIANGRKIILPLSAGLDSRLILGKLVELGYSNILTYTYGSKNIWEREVAEKSANQLGVEWIFLNLTNSKKEYHTEERQEYFKRMCYYISVPHLADYYSLKILQSQYAVDLENSVIVNGQTGDFISGAHIPKDIEILKKEEVLDYTINKHFGLWINLINEKNTKSIIQELSHLYNFKEYFRDPKIRYKLYEKLECNERQIKYVINGQRAYDWYKMDWYLPMWSDEMLDFWRQIKQDLKTNQYLYKEYCKKYNPSRIFDIQLSKNTHSISWYLYPVLVVIKLISYFDKSNSYSTLKKRYLSYFEKYMPFYPHLSYFHYLKEAKHHRNPVSFWVRSYLRENNFNQ